VLASYVQKVDYVDIESLKTLIDALK
jgi:hypothetical protein